jgi:hypothetical protein
VSNSSSIGDLACATLHLAPDKQEKTWIVTIFIRFGLRWWILLQGCLQADQIASD